MDFIDYLPHVIIIASVIILIIEIYLIARKLFPRFKVSFQKKNYEIIKTYLKDNQSFDDFSGDNYPLLMAMVQSDEWEMKN